MEPPDEPTQPPHAASRTDAVLELVDSIPPGRVMTYGDVARCLGIPSARLVGKVLAGRGDAVPWHRVVLSTGAVADHLVERQLSLLRSEGVEIRAGRVDLLATRWSPSGLEAGDRTTPSGKTARRRR